MIANCYRMHLCLLLLFLVENPLKPHELVLFSCSSLVSTEFSFIGSN